LFVAFAQLEALTQIPVETEIPVDPRRTVLPPTPEVEALALENSADLHFQRLKLEVVRFDIKREKIASLPTLSARFEQSFGDQKIAPLPTLSARFEQDFVDQGNGVPDTRYGLVIEGSVEGLGLVSLGRVRGATARLKAAKHQVDATHNEVRRRVNTLMIDRTVQQRLNRSQGAALEAVEATRSSFLRQYENGRKTWLELLNIQREVAALSFDLAQIQNDELILSLRVAALTGCLYQLAGIEAL
jgi:adhesin transport system outer membrane protein